MAKHDGQNRSAGAFSCFAAGIALLVLAPAPARASGESVPSSAFDLPPGASVTITFEVDVDSPLGVCAAAVFNQGTVSGANFPAFDTDDPDAPGAADPTSTTLDLVDLAVTKTNGTTSSVPGSSTTYTITISNVGPAPAVGARVVDDFPAALTGVTWTCAAGAGSACSAAGSGDIDQTVNVGVGGSVTFTATGTIDPAASGTLVNTATATAASDQVECLTGDNSQSDSDTLTPQAAVTVAKDDGVSQLTAGEPVTYTITVSNPAGPSNLTGATVTDLFPPELLDPTYTCVPAGGASVTSGCDGAPQAGNINDIVDLPVGASVTYTAMATVDPATTSASITNTVGVGNPAGADGGDSDTDTVVREADLAITKVDNADPPPAGDPLVYTLTVENLGPSTATGVVVTDPLPAGVTYVSDDCGGANGPPWTWNVGSLADGASAVCNVTVSIDPSPPASISNTATVSGDEDDPAAANDSDTEETTLDAAPPQVANLDSGETTADGAITACETARVLIRRFLVTFSEDVLDAGAVDPGSATNPDNYRLVAPAAPGAGFDTDDCGPTGADTVIPIGGVAYDDGTFTATVEVNGGVALNPDLYRLLVCGDVVDLAGNPLDGGGGSGSDFLRTFRTDPDNALADAHFDDHSSECDLSAWMSTALGQVEIAAEDADASPLSGSAHNVDPLVGFDLAQCVDLGGQQQFPFAAAVRVAADPGQVVSVNLVCDFLDSPLCGGSVLGQAVVPGAFLDTGGGWLSLAGNTASPAGTASALCGFTVLPPAAGGYDAFLDDLFLGANELILADGFESGDTSQWSGTTP